MYLAIAVVGVSEEHVVLVLMYIAERAYTKANIKLKRQNTFISFSQKPVAAQVESPPADLASRDVSHFSYFEFKSTAASDKTTIVGSYALHTG